jgi:hypothetical protein
VNARVLRMPDPKARLAELEEIVQRGQRSFVEVGRALRAIRDENLYELAFDTFAAYCKTRFGMTRPRAYQLIDACDVVDNLSTNVDKLPTSEGVSRALAALSANDQVDVWQQAALRWEQPTAANVTSLIRALHPDSAPKRTREETTERIIAIVVEDMEKAVESINSNMSLAEMKRLAELLAGMIAWREKMDAKRTAREAA